jgi:hypothetical protein
MAAKITSTNDTSATNTDGTRRRRARGGLVLAGQWGLIPEAEFLDLDAHMVRVNRNNLQNGYGFDYDDMLGLRIDLEVLDWIRQSGFWPTIEIAGRTYNVDQNGLMLPGGRIDHGIPREHEIREVLQVLPLAVAPSVSSRSIFKVVRSVCSWGELTHGAAIVSLYRAGFPMRAVPGTNLVEVGIARGHLARVRRFVKENGGAK